MSYTISGTLQYPSRLMVIDEQSRYLEYDSALSAGLYSVSSNSPGPKTVAAQMSDGESIMYGNITPILSSPTFRTVGSGKTYSTVQNAVTAANSGDIIAIYPGTYAYSNINMTGKFCHFRGVGNPGEIIFSTSTANNAFTLNQVDTSGTMVVENIRCVLSGNDWRVCFYFTGYPITTKAGAMIINRCSTQCVTDTKYATGISTPNYGRFIYKNCSFDKGYMVFSASYGYVEFTKGYCPEGFDKQDGTTPSPLDYVSTPTAGYGVDYGTFILPTP